MSASHPKPPVITRKPLVTIATACMFLLVSLLNALQTSQTQWQARPNIDCDNGQSTYRFAEVNADRVNIRELPTVFSTVLAQANRLDDVIVVCEFGVWSRTAQLQLAEETWISSGLITLTEVQPLTQRMRVVIFSMFFAGIAGLFIGLYRPNWICRVQDLVMQTQHLPPHARPLISNPLSNGETPY